MNKPQMRNSAFILLALEDAKDFFRHNGESLSEILYMVGGDSALDLFCEVRERLEELQPHPQVLRDELKKMMRILESADDPGHALSPSLRWHGARLTDLSAAL